MHDAIEDVLITDENVDEISPEMEAYFLDGHFMAGHVDGEAHILLFGYHPEDHASQALLIRADRLQEVVLLLESLIPRDGEEAPHA